MSTTRTTTHAEVTAATPITMRAIVHRTYGGSEVMELARVVRPAPKAHEVLVQVHAAGLDRGVWHLMTGRPYVGRLAFGLRRPKQPVLGFDLAGTVVEVGTAVTRFSAGDDVYGFGKGAFAEYAVVTEGALSRKPANLTFEQAAVVPVSAVTALQALTAAGHLKQGHKVLVIGASGGVGSYAVQLAKALGAEVTAVCSAGKADLVRALGADHVLDYARDDFAAGAPGYDLILDIAGNPTLARLRRALAPRGTVVIVGGEDGGDFSGGMNRQVRALLWSPFLPQRFAMALGTVRSAELERLTAYLEAGAIVPALEATFPLERATEAMHRLESGQVRGKLAITL